LADIFQEIEDDLKHEQYQRLWKRHGKWLIAIAVLLVVATAAFVGIREHRQSQRLEASASYNDALIAALNDPTAPMQRSTTLAEDGGSYGALARLERAGLAATNGDQADAARQYRLLADDGSVDSALRALARVLWGYHGLAAGERSGRHRRRHAGAGRRRRRGVTMPARSWRPSPCRRAISRAPKSSSV
jgi:hypothetical protein